MPFICPAFRAEGRGLSTSRSHVRVVPVLPLFPDVRRVWALAARRRESVAQAKYPERGVAVRAPLPDEGRTGRNDGTEMRVRVPPSRARLSIRAGRRSSVIAWYRLRFESGGRGHPFIRSTFCSPCAGRSGWVIDLQSVRPLWGGPAAPFTCASLFTTTRPQEGETCWISRSTSPLALRVS